MERTRKSIDKWKMAQYMLKLGYRNLPAQHLAHDHKLSNDMYSSPYVDYGSSTLYSLLSDMSLPTRLETPSGGTMQ